MYFCLLHRKRKGLSQKRLQNLSTLGARSEYWVMLGRLGFSLFQLKLSIIYTDNFCLVSLSYVERDNKKRKQNMFP